MPSFQTAYSEKKKFSMPVGSKYMDTYEYSIDKKGHESLVKTGERDIYTPIQEALDSTLIENILQRAQLGDPTALEQRSGQYIDTTEMPTTLAEAQNKIISLKNEFNSLPIDIRRQFDFSPEQFIHEFGTPDWIKKMGYSIEEQQPIQEKNTESEGKTDEQGN